MMRKRDCNGMRRRTYEFRLRPTQPQERRMVETLNACRFVYNWAIEDRRNLYTYAKYSTSFFDQAKYLPILKVEHPWLKEVHAHTLQDALRRADRAFQAFFHRVKVGQKPGYPRFKGRNRYDSFTFKQWGNGASFDGKRLSLSKIGRVRIVLHRPVEGEIKTCTIKRRADGWYALFSVELEPAAMSMRPANPVGVDVGIEAFATLSTGEKIENPRHLNVNLKTLAKAGRKVSRRKKGSGRYRKAVHHLKLEHLRVARTRKDFHFKTAKRLAERFNPICVEKLNIRGMLSNSHWARSISDASWGQFLGILSNKAESAGSAVIAVEARGTSQECSNCGATVPKATSKRRHRCGACGYDADRDVNAARNILRRGWAGPSGRVA